MALQINKTFENGIISPECYVKIISVGYVKSPMYNPNPSSSFLELAYYFNKDAREANTNNMIFRNFISMENILEIREEQYNYLKTLDEFKDASDV